MAYLTVYIQFLKKQYMLVITVFWIYHLQFGMTKYCDEITIGEPVVEKQICDLARSLTSNRINIHSYATPDNVTQCACKVELPSNVTEVDISYLTNSGKGNNNCGVKVNIGETELSCSSTRMPKISPFDEVRLFRSVGSATNFCLEIKTESQMAVQCNMLAVKETESGESIDDEHESNSPITSSSKIYLSTRISTISELQSTSVNTPVTSKRSPERTTPVLSERSNERTTSVLSKRSTELTTPVLSERSTEWTTPVLSERSTERTTPVLSERSTERTTPVSSEKSTGRTTALTSKQSSLYPASTSSVSTISTATPAYKNKVYCRNATEVEKQVCDGSKTTVNAISIYSRDVPDNVTQCFCKVELAATTKIISVRYYANNNGTNDCGLQVTLHDEIFSCAHVQMNVSRFSNIRFTRSVGRNAVMCLEMITDSPMTVQCQSAEFEESQAGTSTEFEESQAGTSTDETIYVVVFVPLGVILILATVLIIRYRRTRKSSKLLFKHQTSTKNGSSSDDRGNRNVDVQEEDIAVVTDNVAYNMEMHNKKEEDIAVVTDNVAYNMEEDIAVVTDNVAYNMEEDIAVVTDNVAYNMEMEEDIAVVTDNVAYNMEIRENDTAIRHQHHSTKDTSGLNIRNDLEITDNCMYNVGLRDETAVQQCNDNNAVPYSGKRNAETKTETRNTNIYHEINDADVGQNNL